MTAGARTTPSRTRFIKAVSPLCRTGAGSSRPAARGRTAWCPRAVAALLHRRLTVRDRFHARELSPHGLAVATGHRKAAMTRDFR